MIDLSKFTNMFGVIKPEIQKRLEAVIRKQTQETWTDAHCIILDGHGTLWQYVCLIDPTFPRSASIDNKTYDTTWGKLPTKKQITDALELAQEVIEQDKYLALGQFKERKQAHG